MVGPQQLARRECYMTTSSNTAATVAYYRSSTTTYSNYPVDTIDEALREFDIVMERNARGRMRARRPPQPAPVDPWVPPEVEPRVAGAAWPTLIRRFRGQRN